MRRYPVVIGATAAGLAGVLSFHSQPGTTSLPKSPRTAAGHAGTTTTVPPAPTAPSTTTTAPSGQSSARTVTGTMEQYGYGQLSVSVTASGSQITKVTVATLQTADQYSQQLADQIIPVLAREVVHAQSARIQGISGATYTSEAYALSVQSAIDKLRA